jgi:hypothetical protein
MLEIHGNLSVSYMSKSTGLMLSAMKLASRRMPDDRFPFPRSSGGVPSVSRRIVQPHLSRQAHHFIHETSLALFKRNDMPFQLRWSTARDELE